MVEQSTNPLAMSDFFQAIHPPTHGGLDSDHPDREAWAERQLALYGASITLRNKGLVRVVSPANGARPDLVEATAGGRAALPT
ncbi:hypothetical protein AB0C96_09730 [Streptomyces sp. NPDC048506]|uniref:hypothetical protein n=1 Tax=Streptomyces sp. NPDC048506 TaxID=3155028 RepID=UPI0034354FBF